jgi:hypothetical protein
MGSESHFLAGDGRLMLVVAFTIMTLPTASMMASSDVGVGAQERWTMGPPARFCHGVQVVRSLRPHVASLG